MYIAPMMGTKTAKTTTMERQSNINRNMRHLQTQIGLTYELDLWADNAAIVRHPNTAAFKRVPMHLPHHEFVESLIAFNETLMGK